VAVAQHISPHSKNYMVTYLNEHTSLNVMEANEKESLKPGFVYVSPPNYHLLIEDDKTFSLSVSEKVNFSRPAIDVLFESAALVYGKKLIGIILTGASRDGAEGIRFIFEMGGLTIAQDPKTAYMPLMPESALALGPVHHIMDLNQIAGFLNTISRTLARQGDL
jgi:two-component system chemotaxis response regulator CheB